MTGSLAPPRVFSPQSGSEPMDVDLPSGGLRNAGSTQIPSREAFEGQSSGLRNTRQSMIIAAAADDESDDDLYESLPPSRDERIAEQGSADISNNARGAPATFVPTTKGTPANSAVKRSPIVHDLSKAIKGMYRILDLITEEGSGGIVDKIIIAQEPLQDFINTLSPGAYASLTKVDFKKLDRLVIKPTGIYGSKDEIVRFLRSIGSIDETLARRLLESRDNHSGGSEPVLRSGLYLIRASVAPSGDEQVYVLFWPEDTTWDDATVSSVRRNRVTFMRYLMKMCDQVIALISAEHSRTLVLDDDDDGDVSMDTGNEESDRLYTFEVAKTNEQEENVTARPGFTLVSQNIASSDSPAESIVNPSIFIPRLLQGETTQGFITAKFIEASLSSDAYHQKSYNRFQLNAMLRDNAVLLSEDLDDQGTVALVDVILHERFPNECDAWKRRRADVARDHEGQIRAKEATVIPALADQVVQLKEDLREALVDEVLKVYPSLNPTSLSPKRSESHSSPPQSSYSDRIAHLQSIYPGFELVFNTAVRGAGIGTIKGKEYKDRKQRIVSIQYILQTYKNIEPAKRRALIDSILTGGDVHGALHDSAATPPDRKMGFLRSAVSFIPGFGHDVADSAADLMRDSRKFAAGISDSAFLSSLRIMDSEDLENAISDVEDEACDQLNLAIIQLNAKLAPRIHALQEDYHKKQIRREVSSDEEAAKKSLRVDFIKNLNSQTDGATASVSRVFVKRLETVKASNWGYHHSREDSYQLTGRKDSLRNPEIEYYVHGISLSADDKHAMQLNPSFVPKPLTDKRYSHSFKLSIGTKVEYIRLLDGDRILLIVSEGGKIIIYLERLNSIEGVIARGKRIGSLHIDKIGQDYMFAFDEVKRALAVCASSNLQLHIMIFDEAFTSLHSQGSAVNLSPWYNTGITIRHMCFVTGTEEILLVDSGANARIFSLITIGFRPASLQLPTIPGAIFSAPDGSCLLVSDQLNSSPRLIAYHWGTFGSNEGIEVPIGDFETHSAVVTSMVNRSSVHLITLDATSHSCRSIALDITRKVTEFMFKEKGGKGSTTEASHQTVHNCLLDCHSDVWTRFPVAPAVTRRTITSSSERRQKGLLFVTDDHQRPFASYFSDMITTFEKRTRKPTGQELSSILISSANYTAFKAKVVDERNWNVSRFRAGEWLVDFLCLIPIHIAVCRENRFIPLKDGVSSSQLEKSLLGAEVHRIVDSLSFGWYESIFQSYLASKPVKVVSSMGEQSVGKSFALNHLVDTSFAGSAMRTTEGVWMSVTPTDEAVIVALDFEGVHSIERSAQEDTLLVLFNTAISNLVLFRNNFALSRDITGLFQSFQSSSSVLDPAANPTLFQSTLVIIIKDVVDSDKAEVTREFSLKFQKIVQDEQDSNFISRLHAGKLNIIPWPVIESKEFYKLFPTLKRRLDQQKSTHHAAGEFLHTLKTLMAKLKANDWGALSQTMAAHRAKTLLSLLPIALETGWSECDPEFEPLKGLDTDVVIDLPDTPARFFLSAVMDTSQQELRLSALRHTWDQFAARQTRPDDGWIADLAVYLTNLADMRAAHVREWLTSNLSRFQASHASIDELWRAYETAIIDLKSNIQLCKAQCASCNLLCIQSRQHEGPHDCQTDHECSHPCAFCDEDSTEQKSCGQSAGHSGKHICVVGSHLCGEPCKLMGKPGCAEECTKVVGHEGDDHMCSAGVHMCGEPCALKGVKSRNGSVYSCPNTCKKPSDEIHADHECENRLCPVRCQLCKRLCNKDHLHGLVAGEHHLCGEQHTCSAYCASPGICEIDTAPQSIEQTFTGRHETFQYTKYTQLAKRLRCVKLIEPGDTEHTGSHIHSTDKQPFHFCEARCESCEYLCMLPLGHTQQEHETSHGSMSSTRWSVDGPDGTTMEVGGRKFSSNDEGAPMMCNIFCSSMGRHVHIDYCRAQPGTPCDGTEVQHITDRVLPNPTRAKDAVTHSLHWRRMGFKDPYSRDEQANFAKCDAMCSGPEHTQGSPAVPSYCTLPLFHPPQNPNTAPAGMGYVSNDGHLFSCKNPVVMQQAFHVIFVIDRSGSMSSTDRRPLPNAPATDTIRRHADNRLGAVFSALYSFWSARHAAVTNGQPGNAARRDAYSVVLFDHAIAVSTENDFTSSPDQLLNAALRHGANGGTNFALALRSAQGLMETHWSTERTPIMIFLSDGECSIADQVMHGLSRSAVRLGKPLSFHAVSFGPDASSSSLRRMAQIALEVQNNASRDPLLPAAAAVPSSYAVALDTVRLAETFLGIAESLRKPRGSLLHGN